MENKEIIEKADLALSDLQSGGGYLNAEQSNAFIRKVMIQPTILNQTRHVVMMSPQRKIEKIGFGKRILRAGAQGDSLDTAAIAGTFDAAAEAQARAKPITSTVNLSTKEVIAEVQLPYDVIEDNIQRGNPTGNNPNGPNRGQPVQGSFKDLMMDMIAERAAIDLEELALLGDTALVGSDPYLGLLDGYLKLASVNVVDHSSGSITRGMFTQGLKAMPDQYLRNRASLKHYVSVNQELDYRETLGGRETGLGDSMITGTGPVFGAGVRVEPAPMMPSAKGLLMNPQNLIFGIQRQIGIEVDKDIRKRIFIIVLTARVDFQIEEVEAIVRYDAIG